MQAINWVEWHGFGNLGEPCVDARCDGKYLRTENDDENLRCSKCHARRSRRGEFFAHYRSLTEVFQLIYAVANRWSPKAIKREMGFRDGGRVTAMLTHLGEVASKAGDMHFKSSCGKWNSMQADETALGKAKASRGARAKRPCSHPVRWYLTMAKFEEDLSGRRCSILYLVSY